MQTIEELSVSLKQKISDQPIEKIKLEETVPYSKHPFRVPEDDALKALAKDIKENGLLEPIIVRVLGFGDKYEILSGHRRAAAHKLNGAEEIEARVLKISDIEAAQIVIKSNFLQREILPSERAKSYMLRNECLKMEKYGSQSTGWTEITDDIKEKLAQEFNVSKSSIFEYIRLNYLIEEILMIVDNGGMKIKMAVALSYFPKRRQAIIYKYFFADKKDTLKSDTIREMKKHAPTLTEETIEEITIRLNAPQKKKETQPYAFVKKYVQYFNNEQELMNRLEKLLLEYIEKEKLPARIDGDG